MTETISHTLLGIKSRSGTAVEYNSGGKWLSVTWRDYYNSVEDIAGGLKALGVNEGERVVIFSNTRFEWAIADFAALAIGAIVVPIYQSSIVEDIEYIINDSESVVVFSEDNFTHERLKSILPKCPTVKHVSAIQSKAPSFTTWNELIQKGKEYKKINPDFFEICSKKTNINDLATICYTSGTTGRPKGVCLHHEQVMSEVTEVFKVLDVTPEDKTLTFLPFAHILGRVEHWSQMYMGWTMAYAQSIEKIRDNLVETHPTFLVAVPRIFEKVYNGVISQAEISPIKKKIFDWALNIGYQVSQSRLNKTTLPIQTALQYQIAKKLVFNKLAQKMGGRLRFAMSGGAPLSKDIGSFFHASDLLILEGYGLTETTAGITVNNRFEYRFGTVGKAIGDVQLKIAADGEILVKSKKVMRGYYKNPEATAEVLNDGWLATGDIGEISDDGFLKITDRKKDLIKTGGGKYVAPQKLENLLKLSKYITNVVIHGDKRKYIVALLTLNQDEVKKYAEQNQIGGSYAELCKNPKIKDLIRDVVADVNAQLASYETIKNFSIIPYEFTVEGGEITPSLKVKRKFCDKKYAAEIDGLYGDESRTA